MQLNRSRADHAEVLLSERRRPPHPQVGPRWQRRDEDYAVINFRGEEFYRTPSRIEAERWIERRRGQVRCVLA
jgi:hypothetical protein